MGNAEYERLRAEIVARLEADPEYQAMKPVDPTWPVGTLRVDPATGTAEGIEVVATAGPAPMVWLPKWRYVIASLNDNDEWGIYRPGHYTGPPILDGYLVISRAVFSPTTPTPSTTAYAPGRDGIGPMLDGDDGPVRWVLLTGYVYHITDAEGPGRFTVREYQPEHHNRADYPPQD